MEYSVLVVSPDSTDVRHVRLALAGYEFAPVVCAESYHEALRILGKQRFSLILCDAGLSRTCWKDLLSQISWLMDPPAMILMAPVEPQWIWAEAINLGVRDVLAKPLDGEEVRKTILAAVPASVEDRALAVSGE